MKYHVSESWDSNTRRYKPSTNDPVEDDKDGGEYTYLLLHLRSPAKSAVRRSYLSIILLCCQERFRLVTNLGSPQV